MFSDDEVNRLKNVGRELLFRLPNRNDKWKGVLFFGPLVDKLCVGVPAQNMRLFCFIHEKSQFESILYHLTLSTLSTSKLTGSLSSLLDKEYHPWFPKDYLGAEYDAYYKITNGTNIMFLHPLSSDPVHEPWTLDDIGSYFGDDPPIFVFQKKVYVTRENLDVAKVYYGNSV